MRKKEFNILQFIGFLSIPSLLGLIVGLFTMDSMNIYQNIETPPFAPPGILFPIVWGILYALMGVSLYLIYLSNGSKRNYYLFGIQLAVNLIWPFLFFSLEAFTLAFVWIILLWILIIFMIISFNKDSKFAAYLQIPYLLWVTFAAVLNLWIAINN